MVTRHKGFPGGAVLPDDKDLTEGSLIEEIPRSSSVQIVLEDGTNSTVEIAVRAGEIVDRGQVIGLPQSEDGVAVHSSVSGQVRQVVELVLADGTKKQSLVIETNDEGRSVPSQEKPQWKVYSEGLIKCLRWAGITQMGLDGGSLVTRIRKSLKAGLRYVIINGVESEPLITSEVRLMTEHADKIRRGCELLTEILGLAAPSSKSSGPEGFFAICGLRQQAVGAMRDALKGGTFRLALLADRYPQDEEVLLTNTLTNSKLRATRDPADAGVLVINVTSVWALSQAWYFGEPVTERVITVAGDGTERTGNYRVPIGTRVRNIIEHVGPLPEATRYVLGGPFRGWSRLSPEGVITKQTTGLTVLTQAHQQGPEACIRCGWCIDDCPVGIDPVHLYRLVEAGRIDKVEKAWIEDCIECGLCLYVCPTYLPLLEKIRLGKWALRQKRITRPYSETRD